MWTPTGEGMMAREILRRVEEMRSYILWLTEELVRIKTVNPPGENYEKCASFLKNVLEDLGLEVKKTIVPKKDLDTLAPHGKGLPRVNITAKLNGYVGKPILHLAGHYDVVPPGATWTFDPFKPSVNGGKLYGLGSSDQKGGIATAIAAIKAIRDLEVKLRGDLTLSFTPDEETGGFAGMGYLIKKGLIEADFAIVTEPSQPDIIKIGHKGALWLEMTTYGKTAHGSMQFLGINAVEKMMEVALALRRLEAKFKKRRSKYPAEFEEERYPTIMLGGLIHGGVKINVVPDRCMMTVDRRLIPEENAEFAYEEIIEVIDELRKVDPKLMINAELKTEAQAAVTSENSQICQSLARAHRQIVGREPKFYISPGFEDLRFLVNQARIPTMSYGPGTLRLAHAPDEYVLVDDLVNTTKVLGSVIVDLLS